MHVCILCSVADMLLMWVVSLFVENMLPFHVIESDSFASFAGLISRVKMISLRTLTQRIETRYGKQN